MMQRTSIVLVWHTTRMNGVKPRFTHALYGDTPPSSNTSVQNGNREEKEFPWLAENTTIMQQDFYGDKGLHDLNIQVLSEVAQEDVDEFRQAEKEYAKIKEQ